MKYNHTKKDSLKILLFQAELYPPSRSNIKDLFLTEFAKREHTLHLIIFSAKHKEITTIRKGNVHYYIIPYSKPYISLTNYRRLYGHVVRNTAEKIISENNIDILQVRDTIHHAKLCIKLKNKYNLPFCFHLSSLFFDFQRNLIKNNFNLKNLLYYIRGILSERTYNNIINNCDVFMPISKYMADYYKTKFPKKRMYPLPIQAPTNFLEQKMTFNEYKNKNRLIHVGQIAYIRRLDFLIKVLATVQKTVKDIELWMVGPAEVQDRDIINKLKKLAKKYSVYDNLRFFGEVPKKKVPIFISKSNIGLSPIPPLKSYKVSSPTKIIEYLSVGIPVVANKEILDQQEVIQKTGGGYCTKYNVEDFSDKIIKLLKNKKESYLMGQKGKEWILKNRSYKNKAKEIEKLYYSLLSD